MSRRPLQIARSATFAVAVLLAAGTLAGQAPVTSVGLGYPVAPLDGRGMALGSTGIGLLEGSFSLRNPADLTLHTSPGFGLALTGERVTLEGSDPAPTTGRDQFSIIRAVVPFGDWAVSLAFGSALEQDWNLRIQDTLNLPSGRFPFLETREQDGGISQIDGSLARRIGPLSLGVSARRWTGSLRQSFTRSFDASPDSNGVDLRNSGASQTLDYGGWTFRGGAALSVGSRLQLSGAVGVGGSLSAESSDTTVAATETDLPTTFEVGASVLVTDRILLTGAGGWSGWSTAADVAGTTAHDVTWVGAGLEFRGSRLLGAGFPLRVGVRQTQLPFSLTDEPLDERALTGGFGLVFQGGAAAIDVAAEIGTRGDAAAQGLEESFQRVTLSFTLRQIRPGPGR